MKNENSEICQFLQNQMCLIVEPSQAFSSSIMHCLTEMGLPMNQILIARKFEDAKRLIQERRPKLLVTEYEVEKSFGLALIEAQEKFHKEAERISMIVTRNSSDSAVAEAAEEQVDAYMLKPFSADQFSQKLAQVVSLKLRPSPYMNAIREGKQYFESKDFENAVQSFVGAKPLDARPTLACFYAGQSYQSLGQTDRALQEFREGRRHQPLHYKCLTGEFENLMTARNYDEAYALIGPLKDNYPLTSRRLGQIFIAAVFTMHFEDLPEYHALFLKLDQRPKELVHLASMAYLTAGRIFLRKKDLKTACDYFEMGVQIASRSLNFLDKVITELIKEKAENEAQAFLARTLPGDVGSALHLQMSFRVDQLVLSPDQMIERGRKLVMSGDGSPEIYTTLVKMMADADKTALAESVIDKAVQDYPDLRKPLYEILEKSAANKTKLM